MPAPMSIAAAAFGLGAATALATVVNVGLLASNDAQDGAGQLSARRIVTLIERSAEEKQIRAETSEPGERATTAASAAPSTASALTPAAVPTSRPGAVAPPPSLPLPKPAPVEPAADEDKDEDAPAPAPSRTPAATPSSAPSSSPTASPTAQPSTTPSPTSTAEASPTPGRDDRASTARRDPGVRVPPDRRDDLRKAVEQVATALA